MTTAELLDRLQALQIAVRVEDGRVLCRGPRGAITPELRDAIAEHREALIALLARAESGRRAPQPAPEPISRDGELRLSFAQERLWFLHQFAPGNAGYHIVATMAFVRRAIEPALLRRSFDVLVERHETLRTTFVTRDGEPFVRVHAPTPIELPVFDLRDRPAAERTAEAARIRTEHAGAEFDLERGPLMRAALLRTSDTTTELLLVLHHIVSDRWSLGVLARELQLVYEQLTAGREPELPPLQVQYVDFAAWQRRRLEGGALEDQLAYWREQLGGDLATLDLPSDRPRPVEQTYPGAWESRVLPAALGERVAAASRDNGVTPFMIFLAGFDALLHRYTGQRDIVIGSPISGRSHRLLEGIVGCFLNMLVLRTDLSGDPTFGELLARVREVALDAYTHADVPFEKLVAELQPRRDTSRSPLFQVAMSYQSAPKAVDVPSDVTATESGGALFDVTLFVTDVSGRLTLTAEYNVDLFEKATIARLLAHLETLLAAALADPGRRIGSLPLLSDAELVQLREWNDTAAPRDGAATLHGLMSAQAARTPNRVAVVCGDESLTYAELDRRSNQLAHYLRGCGVTTDTPVGLAVERSVAMLVGLFGILKAGGAYVPLDPAYPAERLALMLDDAGVRTLVTQASLVDDLPCAGRRVICLDRDWPSIAGAPADAAATQVDGTALAYIIYTSGSTGRPKGVQVPHSAVVNFLDTMAREPGLDADDVLVAVTTLSFDIAGLELYLPLTCGATVVVATREQASDGGELMNLLSASGATVMQATPATWRLLVEAGWRNPAFRMFCGGEALPPDLAAELLGRGRELWNLYGPTETTIWSCASRVMADDAVTIGRPIGNTQIHVLDSRLEPVPVGISGELYIAGDGLARGYRGRPDLTAERFVPNPFGAPGARMYRTGDIARWLPDGRLACLGRVDHQVKVRGFRIELAEIELALTAHDQVKEALVVADEIAAGDRRLVAYVVYQPGAAPTASELRRFVRERLPEYMVPSVFVTLDRIPLLPNGKVDRRSLPGPFQSAAADRRSREPQTPTEKRLADIWQRTLGGAPVGADDNFFDIGGHSLLSMRVLAAIERELGCRFSPRVMFLDSLRQIAAQCDRQMAAAAGAVTAGAGA